MNLYEINSAWLSARNRAAEYAEAHDGEILAEHDAELNALEMERDKKIINTVHYYKNENSIAVALMNEVAALDKRLRAHERNADWAKQYLASIMQPREKMEFATGKIGWRESVSTNIIDFAKIPEKYQRIIPERKEADKVAIKDALNSGEAVDGAELVIKQNISIK
jgi:hypothetical protein